MAAAQKFLFDTDFALPDPEPEEVVETSPIEKPESEIAPEPELPPAIQYSEEEYQQACAEAQERGRVAGLAEAREDREEAQAAATARLLQQYDFLLSQQEKIANQHQDEALNIASVLVRKLFPHLAANHGLIEIEAIVRDCLERARLEPRLVVRCSDLFLDDVKQLVESIVGQVGYEGRVVFLSAPDMEAGDLRVEWADGGAERNADDQWAAIDSVIALALQSDDTSGSDSGPGDSRSETDNEPGDSRPETNEMPDSAGEAPAMAEGSLPGQESPDQSPQGGQT